MTPEDRAFYVMEEIKTEADDEVEALARIAGAITQAVAEEREACANLAEAHRSSRPAQAKPAWDFACRCIAVAIRARGSGTPEPKP